LALEKGHLFKYITYWAVSTQQYHDCQ
jgi:hypothetical protein